MMILSSIRAMCSSLNITRILHTTCRSMSNLPVAPPGCPKVFTGNPYETTIKRKRPVKDPSIPDFEKQECLKWSKWNMLKQIKRRHYTSAYWQYRTNLKCLGKHRSLPSIIRDTAWEERLATPRNSSVTHFVNRCALTSRGRGIYYKYKMSRMVWRDLADHGLISGAIRAKWG